MISENRIISPTPTVTHIKSRQKQMDVLLRQQNNFEIQGVRFAPVQGGRVENVKTEFLCFLSLFFTRYSVLSHKY